MRTTERTAVRRKHSRCVYCGSSIERNPDDPRSWHDNGLPWLVFCLDQDDPERDDCYDIVIARGGRPDQRHVPQLGR